MVGRMALLVLVVLWLAWTVYATVGFYRARRLLRGVHDPELWLPRRERQAHARKLLQREDAEYVQRLIEKNTNYIKDGKS